MKIGVTLNTVVGTVTTFCLLALAGQHAQAGTLYNGWNYSIDSFNDGTEGWLTGSKSKFEFYGIAHKQVKDKVYFAINSNLSLNGYAEANALNGKISYGDLLFNFTNPSSFDKGNGKLYGVRFDATNDTRFATASGQQAPKLGLYKDVKATSVTTVNDGYSSLQQHTNVVQNWMGGKDSYGDLPAGTTYFDSNKAAQNVMASGNFLSSISQVTDFSKLGLDFGHFGATGTYTFGFSVDKKYLPSGDFIASLFAECGNDGIALKGNLKDVPEPSMLIGLSMVGLLAAKGRLRRRELKA